MNLPLIKNLVIGGANPGYYMVLTDLTNLKILFASYTAGGANGTLRIANTNIGYSVTSGKTFTVIGAIWGTGTGGATRISLSYSDNDLGVSTGTAQTNPVWSHGTQAASLTDSAGNVASYPNTNFQAYSFAVPSGKFINCILDSAQISTVTLFGYET